jgi:hypothetical protein
MAATSSSSSDIFGLFPHSAINATHATGMEPTYDSLRLAMTQLNANAASVPSNAGDGILGHLVLTLGDVAYTAISAGNVVFAAPVNPAAVPEIPPNATAALIAEIRQQYTDSKREFQTYNAVDAALKKLLLAATDERFVISLKDRTHGFALVRTRALIDHLYRTYGNITSDDLSANEDRMKATWDPTTPIEGLFEQIDDGAAYASDGDDPFTDTQLVRYGYNNVDTNGKMTLACRDWRQRPRNQQTWTNFKTAFKAAHLDLRLCATTSSAGFQGHANHATDVPADQDSNTDNDPHATTQAYLLNLAEATLANNSQVTALSSTVAQLQLQIATATTALAASQTALQAANGNRRSQNTPATTTTTSNTGPRPYCWTHGARVSRTHTSPTCQHQATGHQVTATLDNRMGGSERGCT